MVLIAKSIWPSAILLGLAACSNASEVKFESLNSPLHHERIYNQVYGYVIREWRLDAYLRTSHGCVFKFDERFLDSDEKALPEMEVGSSSAFLYSPEEVDCSQPKGDFVRIDNMQASEIVQNERAIVAIIEGEYSGEALNELRKYVPEATKPTSIIESGERRYKAYFRLPQDHVEIEISERNDPFGLEIVGVSKWQ